MLQVGSTEVVLASGACWVERLLTFDEVSELSLRDWFRTCILQSYLNIIPMPIRSKMAPLLIHVRERRAQTSRTSQR